MGVRLWLLDSLILTCLDKHVVLGNPVEATTQRDFAAAALWLARSRLNWYFRSGDVYGCQAALVTPCAKGR